MRYSDVVTDVKRSALQTGVGRLREIQTGKAKVPCMGSSHIKNGPSGLSHSQQIYFFLLQKIQDLLLYWEAENIIW